MTLNPSHPPVLPTDVYAVGRPPILVTGASGELGRAVTAELRAGLIPYRALVHENQDVDALDVAHADLTTGAGLDTAVQGVSAVIHCAGNTRDAHRVDVVGTRNLLAALDAWAPDTHVVQASMVGCWENPLATHRAKADAENVLSAWRGPTSIVRGTEFHSAVRDLVTGRARVVAAALNTVSVTPVDPGWMASKLVDVALLRTCLARPLELTGPETLTLREIAVLTAHLSGRRAPVALPIPARGGPLRAFVAGSNLAGPDAHVGGLTYEAWVAAQLHSAPRAQ